jgi:hypothetical protein
MSIHRIEAEAVWGSPLCTPSTAEHPLRVTEFDALFTEAVHGVERIDPVRLRLRLDSVPSVAAWAAQLALRETLCCSFFTFVLTATGGHLSLEISVPAQHGEVLNALADRVEAVTGPARGDIDHA